MIGTRHEEYNHCDNKLPFILNIDLERTPFNYSKEQNWHEDLEIQLCTSGHGTVLLNGERYDFNKNDIVVVNSNIIHYTFSDNSLIYSCLIISADFCKSVGIDCDSLCFLPLINSSLIVDLFCEFTDTYLNLTVPCRIAKLNEILLRLLINITENYSVRKKCPALKNKSFECVKTTINFIRKNYNRKITLDEISNAVLVDKFALCREFKRLTGQTIVEYMNHYRCMKAVDFLNKGYSVTEAAISCGFDNYSFFSKTFKRYMGRLPSSYKNM